MIGRGNGIAADELRFAVRLAMPYLDVPVRLDGVQNAVEFGRILLDNIAGFKRILIRVARLQIDFLEHMREAFFTGLLRHRLPVQRPADGAVERSVSS